MAKSTELIRVGLPIRAAKLRALLDACDPGDEAIIRHHDRQLIVEDPNLELDLAKSETTE